MTNNTISEQTPTKTFSVLFVCIDSITRSPMAHAVFRKKLIDHGLAQRVQVDSVGTYHMSSRNYADERARVHAARRGYDLSDISPRVLTHADYQKNDLILAMDWGNLALMHLDADMDLLHKIQLITKFCVKLNCEEVLDPYAGDGADFETVLDQLEDACEGVLNHVKQQCGVS